MAQEEKPPQLKFIGDEIDDLIQQIRATERDYPNQQDVRRVLTEAIDVLKAAEDSIKKTCGPTWFILR
jgi:hypothetical protein